MKNKLPYLLLIPLLLSSCNGQGNIGNKYQTKTINVYYLNEDNNTTCDIRYYGKSVIPYISFKDIHKLLYRGRTYEQGRDQLDLVQNGDSYTYTVLGGYTATFDVSSNKMESDNLWNFKNTNLNSYGDFASVSYDGLPFTRVKSVKDDKPAKKTVIDFSKYNLKIYGDDKEVYLPITFATDLLSNENILQAAYNNKDLYVFNYTENEELEQFGAKYYEDMFSSKMNKEYSEYVYNELCLDYDILLGRPGRSSLEVYYDLSNGLDAALKSRPLGQKIVEYIKSPNVVKYLAGVTLLGYLRADGGHSVYNPIDYTYYVDSDGYGHYPNWLLKVRDKATKLIQDEYSKNYEELTNSDALFYEHPAVYKARSEKLNKPKSALKGYDTYTKDGDIAYIHIDGFMGEIGLRDEWDKYYKGEREDIPFGAGYGGAVGAINYGVNKAANDDEIKHVVIDLSANTGGSTDEMLFMIALLTGHKNFYSSNTMTDRTSTVTYEFDLNLDKVFDEKDDEMLNLLKGKDISVLTTRNGFSCGGISPIYLHDEGLFTIGEECGGGCCSIYIQYDGYGCMNRSSCPTRTITKNKISVDEARKTVCDAKLDLPINATVGTRDYSALYDTASLRTLINNHYSNK